ncbi:MAG TPA: hypothetical protein VKN35_03560 [Xanthomonadales bacterium]|nr:hypothetical protein [Xanthomonadales bacterium]
MSTASSKLRNTRDEEQSTTRKVASVAHEAIDGAAEKAEPVEQKLRDQAGKAGEQIEATQAAATEQVQQSIKRAESFVREKPVAATGIAFAAGVLAALILRR